MEFSERFDLLMNVTGTSNSSMAKRLALDPSYISRLRRGERNMPRHEDFLQSIAAYFARQCTEEYQQAAVSRATGIAGEDLTNPDALCKAFSRWLVQGESGESSVNKLLTDFSKMASSRAPKKQEPKVGQNEITVYHGTEGRRQAMLSLFHLALQRDKPGTLLLYSDENPGWMMGDPSFYYEWSSLLWQIIWRGNRVKIIHKVSHEIDEMIDVVRQWLPFYASGAIEPYYYPKLRDGVYKRTLSVVPGTAALFSTSIGEQVGEVSNFLTCDRLTVDSFTNEFYSYLALCRPLIRIRKVSAEHPLPEAFAGVMDRLAPCILCSDSLSLATIPPAVMQSFAERTDPGVLLEFGKVQELWSRHLEQTLARHTVCHIIRLCSPADVRAGRAGISSISASGCEGLCYTPDEYRVHLQHILALMRENERFTALLDERESSGYSLFAVEDGQFYIIKENEPLLVFELTESNMLSAFWDYLLEVKGSLQQGYKHRDTAMERLQQAIDALG